MSKDLDEKVLALLKEVETKRTEISKLSNNKKIIILNN